MNQLIPAILYFGYPRDAAGIVSGASVEEAAWATQEALWWLTDTYEINHNSLAQGILRYAVNNFEQVPSDFQVEIWVRASQPNLQNIAYVNHPPKIRTSATWKDGSKEITAGPGQEVRDVVDFSNLIPRREYTVEGQLIDYATGGVLKTTRESFFATDSSQTVTVHFQNLDATNWAGKTLVVFEELIDRDDNVVASHKDLDDTKQQVKVKGKTPDPTPKTTPKTTPKATPKATPQPTPAAKGEFTFKKVWIGTADEKTQFILHRPDGSVEKTFTFKNPGYHVSASKKGSVWTFKIQLSDKAGYYVTEKAADKYQVSYSNVIQGDQADRRCYDGGTITNHLVPKTGDNARPVLWAAGAALSLLALAAVLERKKKNAR